MARVASLSRDLTVRASDTAALLERAHLLLDLDLPDLARSDLTRLAALPIPPALGSAANLLLERVEAFTEPTHVGLADTAQPLPLAPGLLGLADPPELVPLVAAVRALRRLGPEEARTKLPDGASPALAYLRAVVAADDLGLARASEHLPVQIEAALRLAAALERGDAPRGAAAVLFGLAARIRTSVDHPRLRRALTVASALSRWNSVEGTERNAGQERLSLVSPPPETAAAAAREALVAAPWDPRRARVVAPGAGVALDAEVGAQTRLTTQVACAELRSGPKPGSCVVRVSVDGQELKVRAGAGAGPGSVPARTLSPGRHFVTVALDKGDPDVIASVRFLTDRPLLGRLESERLPEGYELVNEPTVRSFAATPDRPVELAVLGPTTLRVELRAEGGGAAATVVIKAPDGAGQTEEIQLPGGPDPAAHGEASRGLRVGAPVERSLVLLSAGAHRVTVRATHGRLLARFALREDLAGRPPPLPPPWWEDAPGSSLLPWPLLPPPLATIDAQPWTGCPPSGFGTLSAELGAGTEPVGERDVVGTFLGVGQLAVDFRRRAGDSTWLRLGVFGRGRQGTSPVIGAGARIYARDLPLSLRADLRGSAATQPYAGEQASSAAVFLRLDRSFALARTVSFVPSLSGRAAWLSLDRATVVMAGKDVDPDVYNDYTRTHPILGALRGDLFYAPYADQVVDLGGFVSSTRSFTADHLGAELEWRSLFPILGETYASLGYRPTYRLITSDRTKAFLRHDLAAGLRWSLWTGAAGRFVLGIDGWLVASPGAVHAGSGLVLRYDWSGGRGLHDMLPVEESFESLVERRRWEPAPPGRL